MKTLRTFFILAFASTISLYAQDPNINWQKSYYDTESADNVLEKIIQTADLGYIVVGYKIQYSGGGYWNARITKLNSNLEIVWDRDLLDGTQLYDVQLTSDNGYLVGGVQKTSPYFTESYLIIKLNENGDEQWSRTIGGDRSDYLQSFEETSDGGYILGGYSQSLISGDKTEDSYGGYDYWVIKIDSTGSIEWQKTIGGAEDDRLKVISQTSDNGYILAGTSESDISGNKTEGSRGGEDYWILKLDPYGSIEWQKSIGGSSNDDLADMKNTVDGGYILTGSSKSDISGEKSENTEGSYDYWVIKLNSTGDIEWQNTIGGSDEDISTSIIQTPENSYLVGGYSKSNISGKKTENSPGREDYWIIKLDVNGNIAWQSTLGGDKSDYLNSVTQNLDGSLLLGGSSYSEISGDKTVPGSHVVASYWVINHTAILDIRDFTTQNKLTIYPNPVQSILNIETTGNPIEKVKIYDINGRLISEFKNIENPTAIDLSRLESGIYFAEISNRDDTTIKKIIKE